MYPFLAMGVFILNMYSDLGQLCCVLHSLLSCKTLSCFSIGLVFRLLRCTAETAAGCMLQAPRQMPINQTGTCAFHCRHYLEHIADRGGTRKRSNHYYRLLKSLERSELFSHWIPVRVPSGLASSRFTTRGSTWVVDWKNSSGKRQNYIALLQ